MALCVQVDGAGVVSVVSPQPADLSTCSHVIQSSAEYLNNPLALTAEDGQTIGTAIMLCWAVAYVVRVIISAMSSADEESASS
ncbi:conserved protein of unknown function (plasmid) [Cupriavidus taiwanensis]|uniref:Uncharacterized protein n=1 Tax=Cupriavidus taiwanensis TaxID=164546 RepID=A0A9Q7V028_9BURK|nr:hypothetical protein [Cupriavidus taiwanensis]SPD67817.1 conserved protein of unknown function [Cupriavidus taiwanensis]